MCSQLKYLSEVQINDFKQFGIVIIPQVLTTAEVNRTKLEFDEYIRTTTGCNEADLSNTAHNLSSLTSTGGSGGVLDIFYQNWKLWLNEDERIVYIMQDLWSQTYGKNVDEFSHPFGEFDSSKGYMYIDRVCYRLPSSISEPVGISKKKRLQRSLTPHLDCCPQKLYNNNSNKWRPIQAFVSLTDTLLPNQGGFEACPGFHLEFNDWAANRIPSLGQDSPPCVGDFTPIRPIEDKSVLLRMTHIPCRAGDMICWDYRIPHANSRFNTLSIPRQVIYIGLLPHISLNKTYALHQLDRFRNGLVPMDQWHERKESEKSKYEFNSLGLRLMGIIDWEDTADNVKSSIEKSV
eukprot:gene12251-16425_t